MIRDFPPLKRNCPPFIVKMACDNYRNQRDMDIRHRHLSFSYADKKETTMGFEEHAKLYNEAGYVLSKEVFVAAAGSPDARVPHNVLVRHTRDAQWQLGHTEDYNPGRVPKICERCEKVAMEMCECECREYFCSKECQGKGWKRHKDICEIVKDNHAVVFMLNKFFWGDAAK